MPQILPQHQPKNKTAYNAQNTEILWKYTLVSCYKKIRCPLLVVYDKNISVRRCCADTHPQPLQPKGLGLGESCLDHVYHPSKHVVDIRLWYWKWTQRATCSKSSFLHLEEIYLCSHVKLFVHLYILCALCHSHGMVQDHKILEHKCQIILKINLNYTLRKRDSKSI